MIHSDSGSLHFYHVSTLLRRRWLLIASFVLLGVGMTAAAAVFLEPRFTAKAQILYEPQVRDGATVVDEAAVETLVEMLISPNHVRRLAADLEENPGLPLQGEEAGGEPGGEKEAPAAGGDAPAAAPSPMAADEETSGMPALGKPPAERPALDYETLKRGLNAYKERQSRLIAVTYSSTDPEISAIVANRAVELYLDLEAGFQRERRAGIIASVADRIPEARSDLDRAEAALRAHQIEFGLSDQAGTDTAARQIAELNRKLSMARSDLMALDTQLDRRQAASRGALVHGTVLGVSSVSGGAEAEGAGCGAGADCPGQEFAADMERMLLDRVAAESRIRDIEQRLGSLQRASASESGAWVRVRELQHQAASAGQTYESLLRRHANLLAAGGERTSARLITTASVPAAPSTPHPLLFAVPAVLVSLIAGGMVAALRERLDQRLRGERDVEEALGVPCLGLVPKITRRQIASLPSLLRDQPFDDYTEAIRGIFLATSGPSAGGAQPTTLLITSCAGHDGKTTLAASLAIYGARLQRKVLVVDLDFRNPGLPKMLGVDEDSQAASLSGSSRKGGLGGKVVRARDTGVDFLLLPKTNVDPLELLAGEEFAAFHARLKKSYDYILLDSGPVENATETQLLASMADRVILTVRWGVTNARTGLTAMNRIRGMSQNVSQPVGVVVNQVKLRVHSRRRYSDPGRASAMARAETA